MVCMTTETPRNCLFEYISAQEARQPNRVAHMGNMVLFGEWRDTRENRVHCYGAETLGNNSYAVKDLNANYSSCTGRFWYSQQFYSERTLPSRISQVIDLGFPGKKQVPPFSDPSKSEGRRALYSLSVYGKSSSPMLYSCLSTVLVRGGMLEVCSRGRRVPEEDGPAGVILACSAILDD
jgi:hypothetical protein